LRAFVSASCSFSWRSEGFFDSSACRKIIDDRFWYAMPFVESSASTRWKVRIASA
jgi:hypothetical protein